MSKKLSALILLILIGTLALTACQRPASRKPIATPMVIDTLKTPVPGSTQAIGLTMTAQAVVSKLNQPTMMVTNAAGESVAITPIPPTPIPQGTPTPTSLPPTPVVTKPATWTVHSGESVYCLARRFNVDPNDMLELNKLTEWSMLSIGDVLQVPQTGTWPGESRMLIPHPDVWKVTAGESIYGIACEYGDVYPEAIAAVNGLKEPYNLDNIRELQIP